MKFNANKARLEDNVQKEKEEDPSKEIFLIDKQLKNCEIKLNNPYNKKHEVKDCRYYANGFCKHGKL